MIPNSEWSGQMTRVQKCQNGRWRKITCCIIIAFLSETLCLARSCVVSCASGCSIVGDPAVWTCPTNCSRLSPHVRAAGEGRLEPLQISRVGLMGHSTGTRGQCRALQATLPATRMTLFSSVSLLQVYQMGLFPGASCRFVLEGIAHSCDGVGLGDNCGAERAHGVERQHLSQN